MKYFLPLRCMYFSNYFFQKADPAQFSDNQSGTGYVCTNVLVGCHCKREIELCSGHTRCLGTKSARYCSRVPCFFFIIKINDNKGRLTPQHVTREEQEQQYKQIIVYYFPFNKNKYYRFSFLLTNYSE